MADDDVSWRWWAMGDDSLTDTMGDTTGGEFLPRGPFLAGIPTPPPSGPVRGQSTSPSRCSTTKIFNQFDFDFVP